MMRFGTFPSEPRVKENASSAAQSRRPVRIGILIAIAVLGLCALASSAALAQVTITDVNPDASDNSDADASSGGRINAGLANASNDSQTFYAASEYGGVFKTIDGAQNWRHLDGHVPQVAWDVEVDPSSNNSVYATSFYDGRVDPLSGIEVSRDAGNTWSRPATAYPNPALEGTANDNTPDPSYSCADGFGTPSNTLRSEPSAFGIGIRPGAPANVFVGTNCGLARSTNSGATWQFIDPTPATPASKIWDVVVQGGGPTGQGILDVCGDDGHFRSTDGGNMWTGGSPALPGGRCSIAASPDESYVLVVAAANNFVYESDDAGGTWTNLGQRDPQGRVPFVVTNQRADDAGSNRFDLWYGDVHLFSAACTTPAAPAPGGTNRCPTSGSWVQRASRSGAHDDMGDLVFDSSATVDACPRILTSDGGAHRNLAAGPPASGAACQTPNFTRSNVGLHALFLWSLDGANQAGNASEDLYFGAQDNGTFATRTAGANPPTWTNPRCCDTFDVLASPTWVLASNCCYSPGRGNIVELAGPGYTGAAQINTYPPGDFRGFTWSKRFDQFSANGVVAITTSDVFFTNDITANPIVWSALGALGAGGTACGVQASVSGGTPTFFVQVGSCDGRGHDQVFEHVGTGAGAWTRIDNTDGLSGGFGIFAADPSDPNHLYASNLPASGPRIVFSSDGGAHWSRDLGLDALMTGNGTFRYLNEAGPSCAACGTPGFNGYPQPSLLAFDPEDGKVLVAGGQDSGVFLSLDRGATWTLVTDPFTPGTTGRPHIPRPRAAYFDHEPAGFVSVYVGSQGRGVWRITEPTNRPPDCSAVAVSPNVLWPPNHRFTLVTLRGATDPDGDPVTLKVTGVTQDEPRNSEPDARLGPASNQVYLRAERLGNANGRVYRVAYEATDGKGGNCTGAVTVGVPHDQTHGRVAVDSAPPSYNSL